MKAAPKSNELEDRRATKYSINIQNSSSLLYHEDLDVDQISRQLSNIIKETTLEVINTSKAPGNSRWK